MQQPPRLATMTHLPAAHTERVSNMAHEEADRLLAERSPAFADTLVPMYDRALHASRTSRRRPRSTAARWASSCKTGCLQCWTRLTERSRTWLRSLLPEIHDRARMRLLNEPGGSALSLPDQRCRRGTPIDREAVDVGGRELLEGLSSRACTLPRWQGGATTTTIAAIAAPTKRRRPLSPLDAAYSWQHLNNSINQAATQPTDSRCERCCI